MLPDITSSNTLRRHDAQARANDADLDYRPSQQITITENVRPVHQYMSESPSKSITKKHQARARQNPPCGWL